MDRPHRMHESNAHRTAAAAAEFEHLRPRLVGVAYGLLGSVAEAEDTVQDAWLRLQRADPATIDDLTGWLVTTTSRLALDTLRSARARRETYPGPWLPEPVATAADPADTAALADDLSWAMLIVLETLTPAERAAFVLHDVFGLPFDTVATALGRTPAACRKLASRARERIEHRRPRFDVDPDQHRHLVAAFAAAVDSGDLDRLTGLLDPDAVLTSDGGGIVRAARRPVTGAARIARFLTGISAKHPGRTHRTVTANGQTALLTTETDGTGGITVLGVRDGRIATLDIVRNPHKLHGLD